MQFDGYWETQEKHGRAFSSALLIYTQFSISLLYHKNIVATLRCNNTLTKPTNTRTMKDPRCCYCQAAINI